MPWGQWREGPAGGRAARPHTEVTVRVMVGGTSCTDSSGGVEVVCPYWPGRGDAFTHSDRDWVKHIRSLGSGQGAGEDLAMGRCGNREAGQQQDGWVFHSDTIIFT